MGVKSNDRSYRRQSRQQSATATRLCPEKIADAIAHAKTSKRQTNWRVPAHPHARNTFPDPQPQSPPDQKTQVIEFAARLPAIRIKPSTAQNWVKPRIHLAGLTGEVVKGFCDARFKFSKPLIQYVVRSQFCVV